MTHDASDPICRQCASNAEGGVPEECTCELRKRETATVVTAAQFREIFNILHNTDLSELEQAGVITPGARGGSDWTRFNNNLTTFVLKLPPNRLAALHDLVRRNLP